MSRPSSAKPERLLIIGNGMASVRLCEEILAHAGGRFEITVVGAEPRPGYNRVLLSALLAGDIGEADVKLRDAAWYAARGITLITGRRVTGLDPAARIARLDDDTLLPFDRAVLATGSTPFRLPIPGIDLPGVMTFRDLADLPALQQAARQGKPVAVIGGGLLGIEAAYGLAKGGAEVTLVHVMDRLMERQLDRRSAAFLRRAIEKKGIRVLLNAQTAEISGSAKAEALAFADGSRLPIDLVVVAVGVRPVVDLAKAADLPVKRGILVDDRLTTVVPFIHAIGECAEHRDIVYGLVQPAYEQARVLARHLGGDEAARYEGTALSTNLKVSGIPVFSTGDFLGEGGTDEIILEDRGAGLCKRLVVQGSRLVGAALVGEADDAIWYRDLIQGGADIAPIRESLIFGRAFCETVVPQPCKEAA
ncbi:pyridine nucleotide-disulfide oxidoreductase [Labrys miyagiensis]|uniref:Pyridine nucleotide-disulfide oxidoreductase n=1 Tax=Labrys miyagiensis TaxID=346912 RepID=A0ABQ6CAZ0_9HYPH|nr:FAD-dependent oxidoreductase [Labrys miyagiensis]GLS17315.1 pyridine nucleotide-disulfide oxidoreductase [Labrys miyagiensis]